MRNGFVNGVTTAWKMLLDLADTFDDLTTLSISLLPPGASRPPSPAHSPLRPALEVDSDDEGLPNSLFDLKTGYQRPDGAPKTIKQLARVLQSRARPLQSDEAVVKDRDGSYDEEADDPEEQELEEEPEEEDKLIPVVVGAQGAPQAPTESAAIARDDSTILHPPSAPPATPAPTVVRLSLSALSASRSLPVLATLPVSSAPSSTISQAPLQNGVHGSAQAVREGDVGEAASEKGEWKWGSLLSSPC